MENKLQFSQENRKFEKSDKLCRICLNENALQSKCLHEVLPDGSLASMVMAVARVEIHSQDGLPATICGDCLGELQAAHGFRLKCERSDGLLRKLYPKEPSSDDIFQPDSVKKEITITPLVKKECEIELNTGLSYDSNGDDFNDRDDIDFIQKKTSKVSSRLKRKRKSSSHSLNDSLSFKTEKRNGDIEINNIRYAKKKLDKKLSQTNKNNGPFICDLCSRPLCSKASLENHKLRMHSEERRMKTGIKTGYGSNKRFHCPECPYSTPHYKAMEYHIRTHTGDKPFKCTLCSARFSQSSSLKNHTIRHSDVKSFACPTCGKQFKLKYMYDRHKLVHSEVRAHVCSICNKGFKAKESLAIHTKRHLNIRDFSCHRCGATFVCLGNLISHSKCHEDTDNFECDYCAFKTKSKKNLVQHLKRHLPERPFKCQMCDYAAIERNTLKSHMTKHTREKKFSCPVCHLKMVHSTGVNRHMLRAHGIHYKVNDHTDRRLIK